MKILGGCCRIIERGGFIPPWICTHGYEEVRNYRKTLFIQSIVENDWWGGCIPHTPPGLAPGPWYATKRLFAGFATAISRKICRAPFLSALSDRSLLNTTKVFMLQNKGGFTGTATGYATSTTAMPLQYIPPKDFIVLHIKRHVASSKINNTLMLRVSIFAIFQIA